MALKEDYLDDILDTSVNEKRKYRMIDNADGTISLEDVTEYSQNGDNFGAFDINITNKTVNELIAMGLNVRCNANGYLEVKVDGVWEQTDLKADTSDAFYIIKNFALTSGYSIGASYYGNASAIKTNPTVNGTTVNLQRTDTSVGNEGTFYITAIDFTDYNELVIDYSLTHGYTSCQTQLNLMGSIPTNNNYTSSVISIIDYNARILDNSKHSKTIDVSNLTGEYYIVGWLYYGSNSITLENVYVK